MGRSTKWLIDAPKAEARRAIPTAIVRTPNGRIVALDLGAWNELPPLLIAAGWVIVRDLRGAK